MNTITINLDWDLRQELFRTYVNFGKDGVKAVLWHAFPDFCRGRYKAEFPPSPHPCFERMLLTLT